MIAHVSNFGFFKSSTKKIVFQFYLSILKIIPYFYKTNKTDKLVQGRKRIPNIWKCVESQFIGFLINSKNLLYLFLLSSWNDSSRFLKVYLHQSYYQPEISELPTTWEGFEEPQAAEPLPPVTPILLCFFSEKGLWSVTVKYSGKWLLTS